MMVDLPLISLAGAALPNQPGASSNGKPVLIRNKTFDLNPDINQANAQGAGWILERATLPANCQGFAVTGKRNPPIYFAFDSSTLFAEQNGAWTPVLKNLLSSQTFGPVFPNPYDSSVLFALTSDKGIQVMTATGGTFAPEAGLNALIIASDVNQIAFSYDNPSMVVVCTESGKDLLNRGDGSGWSDLSGALPTVPIPIRSIAVDCEAIYLGTFGRGLWRIVNY